MRSTFGSVSKTWNSINPATLSGAIDVIVVEQEDGRSHVRLGIPHTKYVQVRSRVPRSMFALESSLYYGRRKRKSSSKSTMSSKIMR